MNKQMGRRQFLKLTGLGGVVIASGLTGCASAGRNTQSAANSGSQKAQITVLYDAFGKPSAMTKDWGFSALVEVNGKQILFDTGNNAEIFAHNVKAKGVDLTKLDFVVMSHRHGDHTSGLNYLLSVNPKVKIYAPQENFGVFGSALPGTFYRKDPSLPPDMRYYNGVPPETMPFGTPWPQGNFTWVEKTTEVAPGIHLISLLGNWGTLELRELSLAIDTPDGVVLVVACGHTKIEKIVEAATAINKRVHLVTGGFHLVLAPDPEVQRVTAALHDTWKVEWIAPAHCTGEPMFAALKRTFGDHYLYLGLGTTLALGPTPQAVGEAVGSAIQAMDEDDLRSYRALLAKVDSTGCTQSCGHLHEPIAATPQTLPG
jgi:7,8-dihydropterin-6-yl-methyl-4-(beta-D-ribofuranosyl)aminobenzene 5'-phosphate synthase